jgi:hypothetical protein
VRAARMRTFWDVSDIYWSNANRTVGKPDAPELL